MIRNRKQYIKSCGCPAVSDENNAKIKTKIVVRDIFFNLILFSIKYSINGNHKIVCHDVLNSVQILAKLEKLKAIAVRIAPPTEIPITVANKYINIIPSMGCDKVIIVHAIVCGNRKYNTPKG